MSEDKMRKLLLIKIILVFILFSITTSFSQVKRYNHEVEFGDSQAEKIIQFSGNGDLNITGYGGDKVLISSNKDIFEDDEFNEKARGLKKIGGGGFSIINNRKANIIIISRPIDKHVDLDVKVPNSITLKFGSDSNRQSWGNGNFVSQILSSIFGGDRKKGPPKNNFIAEIIDNTLGGVFNGILEGDVNVKNFAGIVEVNTVEGDINAENIDGEVIASTVEGDINVSFYRLNKDRTLYFSTVDGDIDITFPKNIRANVMARTMEGDVYSGFNGDITIGKEIDDETATTESTTIFNNIFQSNYITTRINGGGQDIYLSTINGDIYLRKAN
jgi:hypothetical protein